MCVLCRLTVYFIGNKLVFDWDQLENFLVTRYRLVGNKVTKSKMPNLSIILLTCLSLCNIQARAVNLIPALLCDDEGVTQVRSC